MNKQFMIINGQIIVSTDEGMKEPIPYVDNIEDILLFENEITYLKRILAEDEKTLNNKVKERLNRGKESKKISIVGSILGLGAAFGAGHIGGLSHEEIVNTVMGPMSEYLAYAIPVSIGSVGFVQVISLLGLSYRPSKNIISSYEERIAYEKEMIEILSSELEQLKSNLTTKNIANYKEMVPYSVSDEGSLGYLKDSIRLRDMYGYDSEKTLKLYNNGQLSFILSDRGYDSNAIMDFLSFLDTKVRREEAKRLSK